MSEYKNKYKHNNTCDIVSIKSIMQLNIVGIKLNISTQEYNGEMNLFLPEESISIRKASTGKQRQFSNKWRTEPRDESGSSAARAWRPARGHLPAASGDLPPPRGHAPGRGSPVEKALCFSPVRVEVRFSGRRHKFPRLKLPPSNSPPGLSFTEHTQGGITQEPEFLQKSPCSEGPLWTDANQHRLDCPSSLFYFNLITSFSLNVKRIWKKKKERNTSL